MKGSKFRQGDIAFVIVETEIRKSPYTTFSSSARRFVEVDEVIQTTNKDLEIVSYEYTVIDHAANHDFDQVINDESKMSHVEMADYFISKFLYSLLNWKRNIYVWLLKPNANSLQSGLKRVVRFCLIPTLSKFAAREKLIERRAKPLPPFPAYACTYLNGLVWANERATQAARAGQMEKVRKYRTYEERNASAEQILKKLDPEVIREICKDEYFELTGEIRAKEISTTLSGRGIKISKQRVGKLRYMMQHFGRKNTLNLIK